MSARHMLARLVVLLRRAGALFVLLGLIGAVYALTVERSDTWGGALIMLVIGGVPAGVLYIAAWLVEGLLIPDKPQQ